jgi:hypothetical protein
VLRAGRGGAAAERGGCRGRSLTGRPFGAGRWPARRWEFESVPLTREQIGNYMLEEMYRLFPHRRPGAGAAGAPSAMSP